MQNKNKLIKKISMQIIEIFLLLLLFAAIFTVTVTAQEVSNNKITNIEGNLEVFHFDDFAHGNSKNLFYLKVGDKRYRLVSDKLIPVMISGTTVRVSGEVSDNKILLESIKLKDSEEELLQPVQTIVLPETKEELKIGSIQEILQARIPQERDEAKLKTSPNLIWLYVALPIILIVGFLAYVEFKRKQEHAELMQKIKQQNILSLRNYVMTRRCVDINPSAIKVG